MFRCVRTESDTNGAERSHCVHRKIMINSEFFVFTTLSPGNCVLLMIHHWEPCHRCLREVSVDAPGGMNPKIRTKSDRQMDGPVKPRGCTGNRTDRQSDRVDSVNKMKP